MARPKNTRILNGYVVVYKPGHPTAMTSDNWMGYIYEHIYVAEQSIGRPLDMDRNEIVHHLDGNKSNNDPRNLIVMENPQHIRMHMWLRDALPEIFGTWKQKECLEMERTAIKGECKVCFEPLESEKEKYCSTACKKADIPDRELLGSELLSMPLKDIAEKYDVTTKEVKKWARRYDLPW